jgi:glycosyltransferase involved in cell wall biosynthesis
MQREHIDICITHSSIDSWVGGLATKWVGAKLVRTRHINLPLHRKWYNFVHFLPDRLVTCGEAMRSNLIQNHGFPPAQVVSIPTGINFDDFCPQRDRSAVRDELEVSDETFLVLMVAIIRGIKRHEVAIRAFAEFHQEYPYAVLVLAGDGPLRSSMEQLCRELGVADAARFLGHRDDIPDIIRASDVLVLTSRSEGVPQAVTQALGLGVPVVSTNVGGVLELVIHDETGLLVEPERPGAVAAALRRLASEPKPA